MDYKGYLIDLDGTIYKGTQPIPAGRRFIERLQDKNIPFLFVTNNTTKTPEVVAKRLAEEFQIFVKPETVYTAGLATIDYMKEQNRGNKYYAIGEKGLFELINQSGFTFTANHPDYVVVGLDSNFTYEKLTEATLAIQQGALYIGTNPDKNLPSERGLLPGAGALNAAVIAATQTNPVYIGKPENYIMQKAADYLGFKKSELLMVGDNYETDITAGLANGVDTLLVLSGFTPKEKVSTLPKAPTYVVDSLDDWIIK